MIRNEQTRRMSESDGIPSRATVPYDVSEARTIVIRQGSAWQSLAFLCLCLLLLAAVLVGHFILRGLDAQDHAASADLVRVERKLQRLEASLGKDARRRLLLLGMRNHILKVNAKVSLADAYRYAELAVGACEKYPAVDPLFLLALGVVESGFDPQAKSPADARGLYQIWPSTGRLLARALGWTYDEATLYDPAKNTEAAALYLDMLFATYRDPQMVLAEYNGGPLNAGYFRAGTGLLAAETRTYVPRVIELYGRLRDEFEKGTEADAEPLLRDPARQGKSLAGGRTAAGAPAPVAAPGRGAAAASASAAPPGPSTP